MNPDKEYRDFLRIAEVMMWGFSHALTISFFVAIAIVGFHWMYLILVPCIICAVWGAMKYRDMRKEYER